MDICIIGLGKMGKQLVQLAPEYGHSIAGTVDAGDSISDFSEKADVAIEFSTPVTAVDNIIQCFELGLPVVCGTTGWYDKLNIIKEKAVKLNGSLIFAPNFSIGVNLFFLMNRYAARLMSNFAEYIPVLEEIHHTEKLDVPSGTAVYLAEDIIKNNSTIKSWKLQDELYENGVLQINAQRTGDVKGIHTCSYVSEQDKISMTHEAFSRKGFALGALLAAEFISSRHGVYRFDEIFEELIHNRKI